MSAPTAERVHRSPAHLVVLPVTLAVAAVAEWLLLVWLHASRATNEDSTLLWNAAREYGSLRVHQVTFWGQAYGSTLESIPIEVLHALGISYRYAAPLVIGGLEVAGWLLLAAVAWRGGRRALAVGALAAPLLLSGYYKLYVALVPTAPTARFLAVVGLALVLASPRHPVRLGFAVAALGLAIVMDFSVGLVAIPLAVWYLAEHGVDRPRLTAAVAGAAAPFAWSVGSALLLRAHPDYNLHGALTGTFSITRLLDTRHRLDELFSLYAPELVRGPTLPLLATALVVMVGAASRRLPARLACLAFVGTIVFGLGNPKAIDHFGPLLPAGRIFLLLPFALWFLLWTATGPSEREAERSRRLVGPALAGVAVVALLAGTLRWVDSDDRIDAVLDAGFERQIGLILRDTEEIERECRSLRDQYGREVLVVFSNHRALDYACAALEGLPTIYPPYERRAWMLHDELGRTRDELVLWGVPATYCEFLAPTVESCTWRPTTFAPGFGHVHVGMPAQTVFAFLRANDWCVRGFEGHEAARGCERFMLGQDENTRV